jgi:hypothetical protein
MTINKSLQVASLSRLFTAGVLLLAWNPAAAAASISFDIDPFEGTTVRNSPGRQVVGGEQFIGFQTTTQSFVFDGTAFGLSELRFANAAVGSIPPDANVVVLQTTDNDNNPLTPFGAANAADLLAARITVAGPGLFVYFNSSLNLPRLAYSDDLSSNAADLRILARMLTLNGRTGPGAVSELQAFTASNFELKESPSVPEPSSFLMFGGGVALLGLGVVRRRSRVSPTSHA